MIVMKQIDYVKLSLDGTKISTHAHAAYWLASQHMEECDSAVLTQEQAVTDAFKSMAALLGYRVERIKTRGEVA